MGRQPADNCFKSLAFEQRARSRAGAGRGLGGALVGSGGHFQIWKILEHICLWSGMIPRGGSQRGHGWARGSSGGAPALRKGSGGWARGGEKARPSGTGKREVGRLGIVENS